jgi:hypothetical protein
MTGRLFAQRVFYGTWLTTFVILFVLGILLVASLLAKTGAAFFGPALAY